MKKLKIVSKYILIFVMLILIYFSLLYITSLIPADMIKENVTKSSETLKQLGENPLYNLGYKYEQLFLFTDAIMINTAYSVDNKNPIESMLLCRKSYIPGQTTIVHEEGEDVKSPSMYDNKRGNTFQAAELYGLMHNDGNTEAFEYPRYWHGYLVLLRPLLMIFDYSVLTKLSLVTILLLILTLLILIWKKINPISAIIFLVGLASISIWKVAFSLNEITTFYISIISSIILLLLDKKVDKYAGIVLFITGSITSFMDLFTTPLVTIGIPLVIYFLLKQRDEINLKTQIVSFIKLCFLWGIGYGLTWCTKWILTDLILGRNILGDAITQIAFRSYEQGRSFAFSALQETLKNLKFRIGSKVIVANIFLAVIIGIVGVIKYRKKQIRYTDLIIYSIIAIMPAIWFIVIHQHSNVHTFFTYRIYILTIISLQIVIAKITGYYTKNTGNKGVIK